MRGLCPFRPLAFPRYSLLPSTTPLGTTHLPLPLPFLLRLPPSYSLVSAAPLFLPSLLAPPAPPLAFCGPVASCLIFLLGRQLLSEGRAV